MDCAKSGVPSARDPSRQAVPPAHKQRSAASSPWRVPLRHDPAPRHSFTNCHRLRTLNGLRHSTTCLNSRPPRWRSDRLIQTQPPLIPRRWHKHTNQRSRRRALDRESALESAPPADLAISVSGRHFNTCQAYLRSLPVPRRPRARHAPGAASDLRRKRARTARSSRRAARIGGMSGRSTGVRDMMFATLRDSDVD